MASRSMEVLEKRIWRQINLIQNKTERALIANYKTALDEIRVVLSKVYERYAIAGELTFAEMSKYNRLMGLQAQLMGILGPTLSKNGALIRKLSRVEYEEAFYRHGWAVDQNVGVALRWGKLNPKMIDAAVNAPEWRRLKKIAVKTWRADTMAKLDRTITQGLIQGQGYPKMMRALKNNVVGNSAANAMRIARTEGQRAAVQGQITSAEKAEELGINMRRIWDATLDSATRPEHGRLDGQAADKEGYFHTAVGLVRGPLQSGDPSFDINCRCRIREEVVGYSPEVRRIRDEGVQPYITYDEWAKKKGIK